LSIDQHPAPSRADRRARLQTPGFSLPRHLGAFGALAVGAAAIAIWMARSVRLIDLWIVPAYLLAANLAEYAIHRLLMHRPLWPRTFYKSHTLGHHRAFHHDSMEIGAWPEMELVMMPWFSLLLFFVGMAPVVAAVAWALGTGVAGLFVLTAVISFVTYEGMHALYHFPVPLLLRLRLPHSAVFRFLYDHHMHHHRLACMRWANFNISMPLSDAWFGSLETEAAWLRERDARRAQRAPASASPEPEEPAAERRASARR
jgi:hypothetical protein